jgi:aminopeptidase N
MQIPAFDKLFDDVTYTKGKSFYRMVWDIVNELAKHFGSVSYSK